jgi:purine-nucleoside phosphorylase
MPIHVEGTESDIAKVVLLPGDPQRAEYIAKKFLTNATLYTQYRCMYGYTGTYKGKPVSVQATGMGSPSLGIVVDELNMLKAKCLIRVGTCGAITDKVNLGDIIVTTAAHSSHDIFAQRFQQACFSATSDFLLATRMFEKAQARGKSVRAGTILTSETFYEESFDLYKKFADYGTLAVEMEAYALFGLAAKHGIKAATVLTVSDIIFKQQRAPKPLIQQGVDDMVEIVLDTVVDNYDYLTQA